MKTFFFLSGLPRSGSTVLAAILNQNPKIYVSPTSGLIDLMGATVQAWENNPSIDAGGREEGEALRLLRSIAEAKYSTIDKPIIIDKSRGWPEPKIMETMEKVLGSKPKIIATVRDVPDCAASFVRVAKPENKHDYLLNSQPIQHLKQSYVTLQKGFESAPDNIHLVEYNNLLKNPSEVISAIYNFLGLEPFEHDFNNIKGDVVKERDAEVWNIPGLHDVKPVLKAQHNQDSKDVLGITWAQFDQPRFWLGETQSDKLPTLIDMQLEASTRGNFEKGWELAQALEKINPEDDRAAFNRGFYILRQGNLSEGMALMHRGRKENVFGNAYPSTPAPEWDGKTPGKVMLYLEGGLGDQIHQARYAKDIASRGCQVYISAAAPLLPLLHDIEGVSAVYTHAAAGHVYHESWVPGMSAPLYLGMEYPQVSGLPYIGSYKKPNGKRPVIGLRWQGNPVFEAQHHKLFPSDLLFDAVRDIDAHFISLQRDEGSQHRPGWVKEHPLETWIDTKEAINKCDLVISACTSVAHLAGAMGVETWIVTPIMPYYTWALPGRFTPYYDSVILYRQTEYGDWKAPFTEIKHKLKEKYNDSLRAYAA